MNFLAAYECIFIIADKLYAILLYLKLEKYDIT